MKTIRILLLLALCFSSAAVPAELAGVLRWDVRQDLETTYNNIYKSLENIKFFVIYEPDIGANLASFAARWGEDYNRSGLSGIRGMVICKPWYTNALSNVEPQLLSLCPQHITLFAKDGVTSVVYNRPTHIGAGSRAGELLAEMEAEIVAAIEAGLQAAP